MLCAYQTISFDDKINYFPFRGTSPKVPGKVGLPLDAHIKKRVAQISRSLAVYWSVSKKFLFYQSHGHLLSICTYIAQIQSFRILRVIRMDKWFCKASSYQRDFAITFVDGVPQGRHAARTLRRGAPKPKIVWLLCMRWMYIEGVFWELRIGKDRGGKGVIILSHRGGPEGQQSISSY